MAKIVSEKREIVNTPTHNTSGADSEPSATPLSNLFGLVLVALFICGAVTMVVLTFRS